VGTSIAEKTRAPSQPSSSSSGPEAASSSKDKRPEQPKRGRPRKVCPPDVDCPRCWCLERRIPYGGSHTWIGTCKGKKRSAAQAAP
jgi:hypothetical protein